MAEQLIRMACRALLAGAAATWLGCGPLAAAEICHYAGSTDYDGHVAVATDVSANNGTTRIDVSLVFDSITMFVLHVHYLVEEVSTWRGGVLESLAVNTRYLIGDHIVRQQWDEFRRAGEGMQAYRVQAKTLEDFRRRHPGFVQHWDPVTFGQPWLRDYPSASAERRADLDLNALPLPPNLRSPLAMVFYWIRFLPRDGQDVAVFLPGFKKDRLVDLPITGAPHAGGMLWHAPLRYPELSDKPASTATAQTSPDGHLLQLAFELHQPRGTARGALHQEGCVGAPVPPAGSR